MQMKTYPIDNKLGSLIKWIWIIEFSREDNLNQDDIVIPTGFIDIIFSYRDDYYLVDNGESKKIPQILIAGQSDHALNIKYGDNTKIVGMLVTPIGFLSIFNQQSAPEKNSVIDGSETKWNLSTLYSKLESIEKLEDMAKCIKDYFKDISYTELDRLDGILELINGLNGEINIKELASKCNLSESAFVRYFKKSTGITPKAYSNIVRFKHSLSNKNFKTDNPFYDQSHLIKNFKRYTGKTPKALLDNRKEITLDYVLENADFLQYFDTD